MNLLNLNHKLVKVPIQNQARALKNLILVLVRVQKRHKKVYKYCSSKLLIITNIVKT